MARIKRVEIHADDALEIHGDAAIVAGLAGPGFAVVPGFLREPEVAALRDRALALDRDGALTAAAVGRGTARGERPEIRGDRTHWLDGDAPAPAEVALLARLESLRRAVNESLFLGLVELEAHYALYPPGAAYARASRPVSRRRRAGAVVRALPQPWVGRRRWRGAAPVPCRRRHARRRA